MKHPLSFFLLALISLPASAGMYKWVDEHGVTHYGDTIPPQYAGQGTAELSKKGLVIKRTERALTAEERKTREEEEARKKEAQEKARERERRDRALLDTYTSEKEIDLVRDRNLQQSQLQIQSSELRIRQVQNRLAGLRAQADAAKGNGRPVPPDVLQDIQNAEQEIQRLQNNIRQRQQEMDAIRARFEADRQRYRELTQPAKQSGLP
jgi:hypothetical protein